MDKKKKSTGPFISFTENDVIYLEANFYTVCMGRDFLHDDDNTFIFSGKTALFYRNKAAIGLNKIIKEGDPKDVAEAKEMLCSLSISPFRVQ